MPQTRSQTGIGQTCDQHSSETSTSPQVPPAETTDLPSQNQPSNGTEGAPSHLPQAGSSEREASPHDAVTAAIEAIRKMDALRLVIPQKILNGIQEKRPDHWAPYAYEPSSLLSRAPMTDDGIKVPHNVGGDPGGVWDIVLDKFIGHHRNEYYDSYRASLRSPNGDVTHGLVVKLLDIPTIGRIADGKAWLDSDVTTYEFAPNMQGKALPRFAGLFGRGTLFCFVFDDAGRSLTSEELITESVWQEIYSTLNELFDAGVYPPLEWYECRTTICRGRDGHIKIAHLNGADCDETLAQDDDRPLDQAKETSKAISLRNLESYKDGWDVRAKQEAEQRRGEEICRLNGCRWGKHRGDCQYASKGLTPTMLAFAKAAGIQL